MSEHFLRQAQEYAEQMRQMTDAHYRQTDDQGLPLKTSDNETEEEGN